MIKLLPTLPKGPAKKVEKYGSIKEEADEMLTLLNSNAFKGLYSNGFALHNAQVNPKPWAFFVTHKSWENIMPKIICNPKIIEKMEKGPFQEACLSFPNRPPKTIQRYWRVIVEWDEPSTALGWFPLGLRHKQEAFDGLAAIIWQHECEHSHGLHIHDGRK